MNSEEFKYLVNKIMVISDKASGFKVQNKELQKRMEYIQFENRELNRENKEVSKKLTELNHENLILNNKVESLLETNRQLRELQVKLVKNTGSDE